MLTPLLTYYINISLADKYNYFCFLGTRDQAKEIIDKYEMELKNN